MQIFAAQRRPKFCSPHKTHWVSHWSCFHVRPVFMTHPHIQQIICLFFLRLACENTVSLSPVCITKDSEIVPFSFIFSTESPKLRYFHQLVVSLSFVVFTLLLRRRQDAR
jgi:hypothetical protein